MKNFPLQSLMIAFLCALTLFFTITSVTEAASISSRVRILEYKVNKHSKEIRRIKKQQSLQALTLKKNMNDYKKNMNDYKEFKEEVIQMIADLKKSKKKNHHVPVPVMGYAYP